MIRGRPPSGRPSTSERAATPSAKLSLIRADQLADPSPLGERLVRHLVEEDLVVAGLTGGHPSVVLGLGVRHAAGRRSVRPGQAGTVPADLGALPAIEFPPLPGGLAAELAWPPYRPPTRNVARI
ncbi:hypothetical protein ABZ923_10295 [Streptomyces sp. NPDC046881]|uniref:hypothetical protein n=1 Tax=Streptomyces sp. NPDC046881 TaxID=3155374 RepID=UPI0033E7BB2B